MNACLQVESIRWPIAMSRRQQRRHTSPFSTVWSGLASRDRELGGIRIALPAALDESWLAGAGPGRFPATFLTDGSIAMRICARFGQSFHNATRDYPNRTNKSLRFMSFICGFYYS